jgi:mono/diheme cytochrome c family protein
VEEVEGVSAAAAPREPPQQREQQQQEHGQSRRQPGTASSCVQCHVPDCKPAAGGCLPGPSRRQGSRDTHTGVQQVSGAAAMLAEMSQLQADKLLLQGQVSLLHQAGHAAWCCHARVAEGLMKHPRSFDTCIQHIL